MGLTKTKQASPSTDSFGGFHTFEVGSGAKIAHASPMILPSLTLLVVSAAPSLESWNAAGQQLKVSIQAGAKACDKSATRDAMEQCLDQATTRAMTKYVETIRAGGDAMRTVLRKQRDEQEQRELLLELSEAALDPAEVAKRLRFTPDEEARHTQRVTTLLPWCRSTNSCSNACTRTQPPR